MSSRRYRRLSEDADTRQGSTLTTIAVGAVVIALLGWAIATTVVASNRIDPPGTFQCGAATGIDGDLCYDVIIVGGGTAGLAAARQITNDPSISVLVLEAGTDYGAYREDILNYGYLFSYIGLIDREPNRYYFQIPGQTEPGITACSILGCSPIPWEFNGGRMLGGSASVNYMQTYWGDELYWDNFDTQAGSPGTFSANSMNAIFESIEYLNDRGHYASTAGRGNGALPSQTVKLDTKPINSVVGTQAENLVNLLSASFEIPAYFNVSHNRPNSGSGVGVYAYSENLQDFNTSSPQLRWSGRFAFAGPSVMDQVTYMGVPPRRSAYLQNSTVFHLLSMPTADGPRFVGARFKGADNIIRNAYAKHTVIVTGGISTTAILQRSGVGPAVTLTEAGVAPVLINENVGRHLTTHPQLSLAALWSGFTGVPVDGPGTFDFQPALFEDLSPVGVPGYGGYGITGLGLAPAFGLFGGYFMNAKSEGTYNISSPDPFMYPRIVTNAYTDPDDMLSMRTAIRYIVNRTTTTDPSIFFLNIDGPTLASDTLLDAWLRGPGGGAVSDHYYGTARMGTSAVDSVVDNRFRVFGAAYGSLRVCDTQTIPFPTHGNPYFAAMGLGTVCGNLVAEDYGSAGAKKFRTSPSFKKAPGSTPKRDFAFNTKETRMTPPPDVELWAMYQTAIATIAEKYPSKRAAQLISGIMATQDYIRLAAIYGNAKK